MAHNDFQLNIPTKFEYIVRSQRGFGQQSSFNEITEHYKCDAQVLRNHLNEVPKTILDIGSGIGFVSIYLSQILKPKKPHFFLFDKSTVTENIEGLEFRKTHQFFYNDFECTKETIKKSNIPLELFHFIDADPKNLQNLPKMDLIFSTFSWGWHFPVTQYSAEIKNLVSKGSVVIADIRCDEVADFDSQKNTLSEDFNSAPEILKTYRGWSKQTLKDNETKELIKNLPNNYGQTKGPKGTPKGHRLKWVVQ